MLKHNPGENKKRLWTSIQEVNNLKSDVFAQEASVATEDTLPFGHSKGSICL